MCVIIAAITGKPTLKTIEKCDKANPHGIGIAARDGGKVHYFKGMAPQEAFEVSQTVSLPFVMHFRLASAGSSDDITLNHPFPISKAAYPTKHGVSEKVLFHNGHILNWEDKLFSFLTSKGRHFSGSWSDTRLCALIANYYGEDTLAALFPSQKFVTFSANSLRFFGDWEKEENGMVFSNYYWRNTVITRVGGYTGYQQYMPGIRNLPATYRKKVTRDSFLNADYNETDFPVG